MLGLCVTNNKGIFFKFILTSDSKVNVSSVSVYGGKYFKEGEEYLFSNVADRLDKLFNEINLSAYVCADNIDILHAENAYIDTVNGFEFSIPESQYVAHLYFSNGHLNAIELIDGSSEL